MGMAFAAVKILAAISGALAVSLAAATAQGVIGQTPSDEPVAQSEIDSAVTAGATDDVADPWEGFNRKMFSTHLFLDRNLLVPAAKGYRAVTPKKGRRGIRRFLANLRAPGVFVNDILQGEFGRAGETLGRFVVNTTIGAGGFADPAAQIGIEAHSEDFGQTLAVWGVDSGPFLFLPLVGPTSTRDGFGAIVQLGMDPHFYVRTPPADIARYTRAGVGGVSAREQFLEPLAEIESKSLDYYASLRSFYLQSRKREIANGVVDYSDLPDIGEFEEFDELE
ncbi:MAG TPA: VacJ family lipoprotein [Parvularculaceae bacterium]|nr:VacJ family lipoprotein [Parvularculaceae bacterium]